MSSKALKQLYWVQFSSIEMRLGNLLAPYFHQCDVFNPLAIQPSNPIWEYDQWFCKKIPGIVLPKVDEAIPWSFYSATLHETTMLPYDANLKSLSRKLSKTKQDCKAFIQHNKHKEDSTDTNNLSNGSTVSNFWNITQATDRIDLSTHVRHSRKTKIVCDETWLLHISFTFWWDAVVLRNLSQVTGILRRLISRVFLCHQLGSIENEDAHSASLWGRVGAVPWKTLSKSLWRSQQMVGESVCKTSSFLHFLMFETVGRPCLQSLSCTGSIYMLKEHT